MATAVPSLVVGLIAGVFVDRYDRRSVMIWTCIVQAIVVGLIPFLLGINTALLFVAILVNAGVKQFFDPAYESLIPEIARTTSSPPPTPSCRSPRSGRRRSGSRAPGLLASAFSIEWAFWIDALTFLFSAGCIFFLKVRSKMEVAEDTSVCVVIDNLKTGIRTIVDTPILRRLFLLGAPAFFAFGLWNVLLLPMAIEVLGATEFEYGLQEGLTSIGFVVGALFMARYSDRLPIGNWLIVGYLGMGIGGVFYALSPTIADRDLLGHRHGLLQLALVRRPPDAAPAQHAARAARPRVLRAVRHARHHLPRGHGRRRPGRHHRRPRDARSSRR